MGGIECITPGWSAPARVRAASTTRSGGVSRGAFAALNLGDHVGDAPGDVARNRELLVAALALPAEPCWLDQVHGVEVVPAHAHGAGRLADGAWTDRPGVVCAVMTADCLPILLADRSGTRVAALHGGWRGLVAGIVARGVEALGVDPRELVAWLGPAIGPRAYQVGDEVRSAFTELGMRHAQAFTPVGEGRWLADLYGLARAELHGLGVREVGGGDRCTHSEPEFFYSYRRDGRTGRAATLIWMEGE